MILLEKRVKALLRRSGKNCDMKQLRLNDIVVDFAGYTAKKKDNEINWFQSQGQNDDRE